MRAKGQSWPELLWQKHDPERPVWRIEFQFRRAALRSMRDANRRPIQTPGEVLACRQALWNHGTRWLSLRDAAPDDTNVTRWAEAGEWTSIRTAEMGSPQSSLIRERIRHDDEQRLLQGLLGYASSLTAIGAAHDLDKAITQHVPEAGWYLAKHRKGWSTMVTEKRQRKLALPKTARLSATPRG